MMTRCGFVIGVAALTLAALLPAADCQGRFTLQTGIYTRYLMTDNLYLQPTGRVHEQIVTIAPNIRLEQSSRLLALRLNYRYEYYRYLDYPPRNDSPDAHLGRLEGTLFPERNFNIGLYGDARREVLNRRHTDSIDSPTSYNTSIYQGRVRPVYRLHLGARQEIEAAYAYEIVRSERSDSDDTDSQKGELAIIRHQTARTDLRLEGFYEQVTASISPDYNRMQGMAGGEWRPGTSTRLAVMAGMTRFEFDNNQEFNATVLDAQLHFAPGQRWTCQIHGTRTFRNDILDGVYRTWRGEAEISRAGLLGGRLRVFASKDDYSQVDRENREQGAAGEISIQLSPRVVLGLQGAASRLQFEPVSEKVKRYNGGASIAYTPRRFIEVGCRYLHIRNVSDLATNDYVENRADCDARLTYDLIP